MIDTLDTLDFVLPPELEAASPPEARGLQRDQVRLMVSSQETNQVVHTQFGSLPDYLRAGDVLVINTSGTLNAAINARRADSTPLEVHLSTHLEDGTWLVEVRATSKKGTKPFFDIHAGETLTLPEGGSVTLWRPRISSNLAPPRLWIATLDLPEPLHAYLERNGFPIRYSYVHEEWPIGYYQTVYTTEAGSAEMPSAGRAFTPELITRLVAKGVQIAPLLLHTGVASLESHEPPYEEYYRVPAETAALINHARAEGRRIIAVGTTAIRALETIAAPDGTVHTGQGWTTLVITPERGIYAVDGLLTGLHAPRATHLAMLEALAGREHLKVCYAEALREHYLWHEFGDLHLIV